MSRIKRIQLVIAAIRTAKPAVELEVTIRELERLAEKIRPLLNRSDRIVAMVEFVDLISPWRDRGFASLIKRLEEVNGNRQHDDAIDLLCELQTLFVDSGRTVPGHKAKSFVRRNGREIIHIIQALSINTLNQSVEYTSAPVS